MEVCQLFGTLRGVGATWCVAMACIHPQAGSRLRSKRREARARGTCKDRPALCTRAPLHWYGREAVEPPTPTDASRDQTQGCASATRFAARCRAEGPLRRQVSTLSSRKAWARLLAKVHELDVMACPRCGSRMEVIAVILDPAEIRKATSAALGIMACLARHGRGPPTAG